MYCSAHSGALFDTLVSLSSTTSNIKVVYTIRADFSSRLLSHRRLVDETQDSDVKIGPMNREELDSVIRKPALQHNVRFEDGLVDRILGDAGAEPGILPLLEFALTELWSRQVDQMLTHSAYDRIGQLPGAIAHRAEKCTEASTHYSKKLLAIYSLG
jgi:hypothetical protein